MKTRHATRKPSQAKEGNHFKFKKPRQPLHLNNLPRELLGTILNGLPDHSIANLANTDRRLRQSSKEIQYERISRELRSCVTGDNSLIQIRKSLSQIALLTEDQMIRIITETIKVATNISDDIIKSKALQLIAEHLVTIEGKEKLAITVAKEIPDARDKAYALETIKNHLVTTEGNAHSPTLR